MRILSIDVGIKNLALCLIETINISPFYKIIYWKVLDLCENDNFCCDIKTNGKICTKSAKFTINNINYCKQHASKTDFKLPTSQLIKYKRYKIDDLKNLVKEYEIEIIKPENKINLMKSIENFIESNVL